MLKNFIADATSKLSSLSTDERVIIGAHGRIADSSVRAVLANASSASTAASAASPMQSTQAAQPIARKEDDAAATFTAPANQPVVAAATPNPSVVEKDFSGFGDTDDDFGFDDID